MIALETVQKIRKSLEKELKPDRFTHTLGVAYTATSMAMAFNEDVDKALIAGLLHDCAKCMSHEDQIELCKKNDIALSDTEKKNHSLLHAKVGMYLARTQYDVYDTEILNAIRWHTTGKEDMSMLEKIIYIADFIEPGRKPLEGMDIIRKEAFTDIDRCLAHILHDSVIYLQTIGKEIDNSTMDAYLFYKKYYK